jgi:hypothetical protein
MKRIGVFAWVALVAAASGCASQAKYIEKKGDSGVVAIPKNTDTWPNYHRREALALIEKHVGPDYEIVTQGEVVTGQTTLKNAQVNTEQTANRRNPALPGERQTATSTTTQQDITEWRIVYRKKERPEPFINDINASGTTVQTRYPETGVQPVGGVVPRGTTGTGSYMIPTTRPPGAAPTGADCNQ